jgi:hypothetical protein
MTGRDGSTPAYLALEWMVVEGIARASDLPKGAQRIAGIDKARAALRRGERLGARNYLKTPKVFGFHGIFKRLAVALDIVDSNLALSTGGERLLREWERDQPELAAGFLDGDAGTVGGSLRRRLAEAAEEALTDGQASFTSHQRLQRQIPEVFRPDGARTAEKAALLKLLHDPGHALRRELIGRLWKLPAEEDAADSDYLEIVEREASGDLRVRLLGIRAYEALSAGLMTAFNGIRFLSTSQGSRPVSEKHGAQMTSFRRACSRLPQLRAEAVEALSRIDQRHEVSLRALLSTFFDPLGPEEFFDLLVRHHENVQSKKPPHGKQPWFDRAPGGVVVRHAYRLPVEPELDGLYIHPFRLTTIVGFLEDLR